MSRVQENSVSFQKILNGIIICLLLTITIPFTWTPLVILLPILMILTGIKVFHMPFKKAYVILFLSTLLIFYGVNNQIIYIEWVRNIMIAIMIPVTWILFYGIKYEKYLYFLKILYYSCWFVVMFILIVEVPQNLNLFFGGRRGFLAREFLVFGRRFPFSLGVTHLNVYVNFIFTFIFLKLINTKNKSIYKLLCLIVLILSLLTQSRSPLLFLLVLMIIYYKYVSKDTKTSYYVKLLRTVIISLLIVVILVYLESIISIFTSSERMMDLSRFIFYAKGWAHMLEEPFGNSLLYSDISMPLLNYHNTFLALGNRIGLWAFVLLILLFIYGLKKIARIKSRNVKYSFIFLLYFFFHNYMIEDIVKFDYFVFILHLSIYPILTSNRILFNENK